MPWDGTQLCVAQINADGSLGEAECIAGGVNESVFQPEWSPDGVLYFVSDRTGWWNLYRWLPAQSEGGLGGVESLYAMDAEFGLPHWVFGMSTYGFESTSRIICTYTQKGSWYLASLDLQTKQLEVIETPYTDISSLQVVSGKAAFTAGSATEPTAIVQMDLVTQQIEVLRRSSELEIDTGYLSTPQAIAFPTENDLTAYAFFYPHKTKTTPHLLERSRH
jgi:dipeptidyl aminopeptidase/acylaminoacyl peptidase